MFTLSQFKNKGTELAGLFLTESMDSPHSLYQQPTEDAFPKVTDQVCIHIYSKIWPGKPFRKQQLSFHTQIYLRLSKIPVTLNTRLPTDFVLLWKRDSVTNMLFLQARNYQQTLLIRLLIWLHSINTGLGEALK